MFENTFCKCTTEKMPKKKESRNSYTINNENKQAKQGVLTQLNGEMCWDVRIEDPSSQQHLHFQSVAI